MNVIKIRKIKKNILKNKFKTELILQNSIIYNSDIFILVLNILIYIE